MAWSRFFCRAAISKGASVIRLGAGRGKAAIVADYGVRRAGWTVDKMREARSLVSANFRSEAINLRGFNSSFQSLSATPKDEMLRRQ